MNAVRITNDHTEAADIYSIVKNEAVVKLALDLSTNPSMYELLVALATAWKSGFDSGVAEAGGK